MQTEPELVDAVVSNLRRAFGEPPAIAVVLGSGLGGLAASLADPVTAPYEALGLPRSTVHGHASSLVCGSLGGARVAVLSGRVHLYEGREPAEVVRYVRALARWGVRRLLLTSSVGGIGDGFDPGTLVIVSDHLNLQGRNPLVGPAFGERFPDLSTAYDPTLRAALRQATQELGVRAREGVLAALLGPTYETPAEIVMLGRLGADVVGMSTVPEILAAAEIGLPAAAISLVSNKAAGLAGHPLSHAEVTEAAHNAGDALTSVIRRAIALLS